MNGTAILDRRGRFLWTSWVVPEAKGKWQGKPVWHFAPPHEEQPAREALSRVLLDGEPAQVTLHGPGKHVWETTLMEAPDAHIICQWREVSGVIRLTPRENQALLALCADEPEKVTAQRLGVSIKTIDTFRASLRKKTGAAGIAGLVRYAVRAGIIEA